MGIKMNRWFPVRYIAALVWMGMLIGISFLEAPLKFQAPSVTLAIGLEVGRLVFQALNKVEWMLWAFTALSVILSSSNRLSSGIVAFLFLILLGQTFYLLPILDQRAVEIIAGGQPEASNMHFYYVALEVVKLGLLTGFCFYTIYVKPKHDD